MGNALSAKQTAFCREYMVDRNATAAYIRAGYRSSKAARVCASNLLTKPNIRAFIAELEAVISEKVMMDAVAVVQRYVDIATLNINELSQGRIGSCRYCHGIKHQYQWRHREEFHAAVAKWLTIPAEKKVYTNPEPSDDGGYGYRMRTDPHPECLGCDGFGEGYVHFPDTTKLSKQALTAYNGTKLTKDGREVRTLDRLHALDMVAKHLGVFERDNQQKSGSGDALAQYLIEQINGVGSKAVLNRGGNDV